MGEFLANLPDWAYWQRGSGLHCLCWCQTPSRWGTECTDERQRTGQHSLCCHPCAHWYRPSHILCKNLWARQIGSVQSPPLPCHLGSKCARCLKPQPGAPSPPLSAWGCAMRIGLLPYFLASFAIAASAQDAVDAEGFTGPEGWLNCPYAERSFQTDVYFGDGHLRTSCHRIRAAAGHTRFCRLKWNIRISKLGMTAPSTPPRKRSITAHWASMKNCPGSATPLI